MNFLESFRTALEALLANRVRSILTMLGVIIGVLSVILLVAVGQGASDFVTGTAIPVDGGYSIQMP